MQSSAASDTPLHPRIARARSSRSTVRMLGAIAGDIIGSVHEHRPIKSTSFPLFCAGSQFTDDTVLTVAVADCLLHRSIYANRFEDYYYRYPNAGYGARFHQWASSHAHEPYNSWGNGSAMRASPVGWAFPDLDSTLAEARRTAEVTHNHPEGIKGAEAVAAAVFLARHGSSKGEIRRFIEQAFGYDLSRSLAEIRPSYSFDVSCAGTVPQAIISFLEAEDFEGTVRNAVSLGGDADTLACIAGGIAEAYFGEVPQTIASRVFEFLDEPLAKVTRRFMQAHGRRRT